MSKDKIDILEKPVRIHQIAKELNIASSELVDFLKEQKYPIKNIGIMTKIDGKTYNEILERFQSEKVSAEKKIEYKKKILKLTEPEKEIEESVLEIPVKHTKLKAKDKSIEIRYTEIEEVEEPPEVVEEKPPTVKKVVKAETEVVEKELIEKPAKIKEMKPEAEIIPKAKIVVEKESEVKPEQAKVETKKPAAEEKPDFRKFKKKIPQRKLSKEGIKVAEKIKAQKEQKIPGKDEKIPGVAEKKKGRKRFRKKKFDQKEIDASIKETFAKMDGIKGRKKYKKTREEEVSDEKNLIRVSEFISVAELSDLMEIEAGEVIKKCMEMGLLVTINQRMDFETITMVADEFGYDVDLLPEYGIDLVEEMEDDSKDLQERTPIVTIMGHVDHGKTSLLDFIRKSNIVAGEIGGITQHIGAYEVEYLGKKITFLDTPGHEAFTAMRARGAQVTDIVILVVAADDNVMPQTIEAINHSKAAQVPIIIAINKIDKPNADSEKIKKHLADIDILVESWGGKYPSVDISAKTGQSIDELLELIILQAEMMELKANPNRPAKGVIIEAKLDKGRGPIATVLVSNGSLNITDTFIAGQFHGRVRAMLNERGKNISEVPPSTPIQVVGFSGVPQAGDTFMVLKTERETKEISLKRQQLKREQEFRKNRYMTLDEISRQIKFGVIKELDIIIKADADGSVEALSDSLLKLSSKENNVVVNIIHKGTGIISETDILLASASNAIIIGFHVRPNSKSREIAAKEKVDVRLYSVIYDVIDDVKKALEGLLEPEFKEEVTGTALVRDVFRISKIGNIAGSYIESGKILRSDKIRIVRDGKAIYDGRINSLKRFKDDTKEVTSGFECGIGVENFNDIKMEDVLEAYKIIEIKRTI